MDEITTVSMDALIKKAIYAVDTLTPEQNDQWYKELYNILNFSFRMEEGSAIVKYYALAQIKENWDKLPLEERNKYNLQFAIFAAKWCPSVKSYATVENYIRAAQTFIGGEFAPTSPIRVPRRDEARNLVLENGKVVYDTVEWNVTTPSLTKLVLCTAAAKSGVLEANDRLLSLLMDEGATADDVRQNLYGSADTDNDPSLVYSLEGPMILATEHGSTVAIAEIDWLAYEMEETAKHGIDRMLQVLGIIFKDEDKIVRVHGNALQEKLNADYQD